MDLNLVGKRAVITGISKGIGLEIAKSLLNEGVIVAGLSRTRPKLKGIQWLKCDFRYRYTFDLSNADILINNVGGGGTWSNPEEQMQMNYRSMRIMTDFFLKKKKKWGRVITISSIYGKEKGPNAGFVASKSAQIGYMKSLAGTVEGITFNTICPGHIDVGKRFPFKPKKVGQPEDVANLVTFLCSDQSKHINGACITVDGGESKSF